MNYLTYSMVVVAISVATACGPRVGATGAQGAPGQAGQEGPSGAPGSSGSPGEGCTSTPVAATGVEGSIDQYGGLMVTCANGSNYISNGAPGENGEAGTPGTTIKAIQFCPNVTPEYPSSFPESGLCIGGNMWGVFSENGGFWAELPPGEYSSDGINASCTFTIEPNCVIVN